MGLVADSNGTGVIGTFGDQIMGWTQVRWEPKWFAVGFRAMKGHVGFRV